MGTLRALEAIKLVSGMGDSDCFDGKSSQWRGGACCAQAAYAPRGAMQIHRPIGRYSSPPGRKRFAGYWATRPTWPRRGSDD